MPSDVMDRWLAAGADATVGGVLVRPRRHPLDPAAAICMGRSQGETYPLDGADGMHWILKKLSRKSRLSSEYVERIRAYVPVHKGLECGTHRLVLASKDLAGPYAPDELRHWLDGTILMPLIVGRSWSVVLESLVGGNALAFGARARIALSLAGQIEALEVHRVAHRDLSSQNILVDGEQTSLIDWDSLYHPDLPLEPNTTVGTSGYIAPWIGDDLSRSWCEGADRYALAVCVAEILVADSGMALHGDGGLLDQAGGAAPSHASLSALGRRLDTLAPSVGRLFRQTISADQFAKCPSAARWVAALKAVLPPRRLAVHELGEGDCAKFGVWWVRVDGDHLGLHSTVCTLEFPLRGLGAFSARFGDQGATFFADGTKARGCRQRIRWSPQATGDALLVEGDAALHHYEIMIAADMLRVRHALTERAVEIERERSNVRVLAGGASMELTQ